jgi:hypothetical protein
VNLREPGMFGWFQKRPVVRTPFSEQVHGLLRGTSTIDECAHVLRQYERKWDLEHIAPGLEVYVENNTIKTRSPARFAHVIGLPEDEALWDRFVRERYYGFLSDTDLVLCTSCYSGRYDIVFSKRYSFQATARAWGAMYADWANRVAWQGSRCWGYCEFYGYSHLYVDGGEAWEDAALKVIEHKTRQTADEPGAALDRGGP